MNAVVSTTLSIAERIPWEAIFGRVQSVFWVLNAVLVVAIILVFPKTLELRPRFSLKVKPRRHTILSVRQEEYKNRWGEILVKAESAPPHSYTLAVIEADGFVDTILKDLGFGGAHMADRLEHADLRSFRTLDGLWKAHRIRNHLVHTPGFELNVRDAERYLRSYHEFLREMGIL